MRILAVDPGNVRIGLAISDPSAKLARPLDIIDHFSRAENAKQIAEIAAVEGAELILVGNPTESENQSGIQSRKAKRLAAAIREASNLPVEMWDESYSSQTAEEKLSELGISSTKKALDDLAAAIILQDYLDSRSTQDSDGQ